VLASGEHGARPYIPDPRTLTSSMRIALSLVLAVALAAPALAQSPMPPRAAERPVELTTHDVTRVDPYFWLRERENPEVIEYIEAETAYARAVMAPLQALEEELFEEIVGRIQQDDASVPYLENGYYYYTRFEEGRDYPIYARRAGSLDAPEEVILDVNELAEGHSFYQVAQTAVSDDGRWLAFTADTVGRRIYRLHVKDLATGEILPSSIYPTSGNVVWAADNETLFFGRQDLQTLRPYQVVRYRVGQDPEHAEVVFQEDDDTFYTFVTRSKSGDYLMAGSFQTVSTEWHVLRADDPAGDFRLFEPRQRDHRYQIDHAGDHFYVLTDIAGAKNGRLVRTPVVATTREHWEEVVPHREDVLLESFEVFRDFLVLQERERGLTQLRIRSWDGPEHYLAFDEPAYTAGVSVNREYDTPVLRFVYASMTTPRTTYDYDMATRERTLLKRDAVLGDFDPAHYATERLYARAADGVEVPVSLVYHRDTRIDGTAPLLLQGYGSYGLSRNADFSIPRLSLLDRGFVVAIAHIRGGQEMGRQWYEDGKLLNKMNTFTDFIAVGEHLVDAGYASPEKLYAQGGSAGGLLMGAVVNLRPDLFKGIIAAVPFVDVVTTMLDDSIPLTTFEYDEWGNPTDPVYFEYMLSYSPYDNVEAKDYPAMLVTTGFHDSQVQYWEPAKWVARLRAMKTDDQPLLFITNMEAGHGGASGRFRRFREIATDYAFLIGLADGTLGDPARL
jgi:oligopeptidase B